MTLNGGGGSQQQGVNLMIASVVLTGLMNAAIWLYGTRDTNLANDERDIAALKVSIANLQGDLQRTNTIMENDSRRSEAAISAINQSLVTLIETARGLKDANDLQTASTTAISRQVEELHKQVSDLDLVLRPIHAPPNYGH